MADGIQIRITGDDSEFLKTLSSLESSALATLEGLTAAASAAGGAFGEAMARYGAVSYTHLEGIVRYAESVACRIPASADYLPPGDWDAQGAPA